MPDIVTLGAAKASFGISKINNEGSDTQAGKVWTTTQNGAGWSQPVGSAYFDSIQQNPDDETGGKVIAGSFPNVDPTLTGQGDAADAKATGDALATKQDVISDLSTIRSGASAGASALPKDPTNWPAMTDTQKSTACAVLGAERAKREWILLGTLTQSYRGFNVDMSNYSEIYINGEATVIDNTHIAAKFDGSSNMVAILYNAFTTEENAVSGIIESDTNLLYSKVFATYDTISTPGARIFKNNKIASNIVLNKNINEIISIGIAPKTNIKSCNVRIYAR